MSICCLAAYFKPLNQTEVTAKHNLKDQITFIASSIEMLIWLVALLVLSSSNKLTVPLARLGDRYLLKLTVANHTGLFNVDFQDAKSHFMGIAPQQPQSAKR